MGKSGIYCYKDLENNNEIVYIGKDSNIHYNNRHYDHISPSKYNQQQINRILQNNPHRYQYNVLKSWETSKYSNRLANVLEIIYIKRYNPKFNFTKGGDGLTGHNHSEETNRNCYMMELDPHYCQVIINRWETFTGQKAIKLN